MTPIVRTRFAPSPTGYMHIGGMRTALFNWLWAKHHGGQFILRIDDTDQKRNLKEAIEPILNGFRWLGLDWDEGPEIGGSYGPYFQSERMDIYANALVKLFEKRKVYFDFDPPKLTQQDRQEDEKAKRPYLSRRRSLELSEEQIREYLEEGRPYVVRLLVPREETIVIDDAIRGRVEFDAGLMPDPVIARGDGSPLYNFASVVDDAEMKISHVIRAEEHLSNTPIQSLLFDALDYEKPIFAHIPYVAAPGSKEKLSKRKLDKYRNNPKFKKMFDAAERVFPKIGLEQSLSLDPVMVEYYEKIGYLPAGILNSLGRLGWSLDDKTEFFSLAELVENFSLERVVKSPAGFDPEKLLHYQSHWMNQLSLEEKVAGAIPYLEQAKWVTSPCTAEEMALIQKVIEAMQDRLVLFSDVLKFDEFFTPDEELSFDEKGFKKRIIKPELAVELLGKIKTFLATRDSFDAQSCDENVHQFVEQEGIGIGQIIHALRVAITGKPSGVGMFDAMAILGRERCVERVSRALEHAESLDQNVS